MTYVQGHVKDAVAGLDFSPGKGRKASLASLKVKLGAFFEALAPGDIEHVKVEPYEEEGDREAGIVRCKFVPMTPFGEAMLVRAQEFVMGDADLVLDSLPETH